MPMPSGAGGFVKLLTGGAALTPDRIVC